MVDNFLQKVNLTLLQKELNMTLQQISEFTGVSLQTIYKWAWDKERGGSRPVYDTCKLLLDKGASLESMFGVGQSHVASKDESSEEFDSKVKESMLRILSK